MAPARITDVLSALFRNWISRWADRGTRRPETFGERGERAAARFLRRNGYRILRRNYRPARGGEIDLVCRDRSCGSLVFVEVKARSSEERGSPAEAVNPKKQRRLARGAAEWLGLLDDPSVACRFDVVEIVGDGPEPEVRLIRDAFRVEDPWRL
jgi:putative endonuclease